MYINTQIGYKSIKFCAVIIEKERTGQYNGKDRKMGRYIAADCGKYQTKTAAYDTETKTRSSGCFRTKISEGTFADDMFGGRHTGIFRVDGGPVYKIGQEAKTEPDMETSKKSEIHRVCTLAAIARTLGAGVHEGVTAVIGIPLQTASIPEERIDYKDFILGREGETHTVEMKLAPAGPVETCEFTFSKRLVYPEGIGVLYEYPAQLNGPTAIIDIGNLNTNNIYCDSFLIMNESCFTDELGGKVLISGLSQALTAELGMRTDDNLVASTLLRPYEERYLRPVRENREIEERSRQIIDRYLLEHVSTIRRKLDTRQYPLDFMNIVCIGGTASLLKREIAQVFGENAFIPENPEFVNANGFLRRVLASDSIDLGR